MEKFSTWRDKGTGISPFLPIEAPTLPVSKYVVNPLRLACKWPLFVVFYALISVVPKPAIRAIFFLISVGNIDISVEGVRKLKTAEIYAKQPGVGDVVISNFVSPLDILVLFVTSKVSSVSSVAVLVPIENEMYLFSVWQALRICFLPIHLASFGTKFTGSLKSLMDKKLVVFFAEGTPTNNKAIMPLSHLLLDVIELVSVKVAVLRYYPGVLCVPVPYISPKAYVSKLLTAGNQSYVKLKIVPLEKPSVKECQRAFTENGLSQVELSVRDKKDFFKYYEDYGVKDITKK